MANVPTPCSICGGMPPSVSDLAGTCSCWQKLTYYYQNICASCGLNFRGTALSNTCPACRAKPNPFYPGATVCPNCWSNKCTGNCLSAPIGYKIFMTGTGSTLAPLGKKEKPIDTEKLAKLEKTEPRKVLMKVPDLIEPITAYRAWKVKSGKLSGIGVSYDWEPKKKQVAHCRTCIDKHVAPKFDCECGFWGFKNLEKLMDAANNTSYPNIKVIGKVALWGKIIECENGFRSEFAYPTEIWGTGLSAEETENLGTLYGVPVRTL